MKKAQIVAGALLGIMFVVFGLNFFLQFIPIPPPPEGSPAANFIGAMYTTGFFTFVKVLEILGGVLTAIPKTRALGLLILTPVIVNIVAFHVFITSGYGVFDPPVIGSAVLAAFLIWSHRKGVAALLNANEAV
jgi:putative oxidoreductase